MSRCGWLQRVLRGNRTVGLNVTAGAFALTLGAASAAPAFVTSPAAPAAQDAETVRLKCDQQGRCYLSIAPLH